MNFPLRFNIVFWENCFLIVLQTIEGVPVLPRVVHLISLCPFLCVFWFSICFLFVSRYEQIETEIHDRPLILEVNRFSSCTDSQNKLGQLSKTHSSIILLSETADIRCTEVIIDKCCVIHVLDVLQCQSIFLKHIKHETIWDLISSFSKNDAWLISAPESSIKHSDRYVCSYLPMPDWVISQCSQWAWRG